MAIFTGTRSGARMPSFISGDRKLVFKEGTMTCAAKMVMHLILDFTTCAVEFQVVGLRHEILILDRQFRENDSTNNKTRASPYGHARGQNDATCWRRGQQSRSIRKLKIGIPKTCPPSINSVFPSPQTEVNDCGKFVNAPGDYHCVLDQ